MGVPAKKREIRNSGCEVLQFPNMQEPSEYIDEFIDHRSTSKSEKKSKSGKSTEVDHLTVEDARRMLEYFEEKENWMAQLILTIALNTGRRAGDLLRLRWESIVSPDGSIRDKLCIQEEKTDKFATIHINSAFKQAVRKYLDKTGLDPSEDNYRRFVFENPKTKKPIDFTTYWRWLKKGQDALSIDYKVGTHSARKTFGWITIKTHPGNQEALATLQAIFNHSDPRVTKRYIGITKDTIAKFYGDVGEFFCDYIAGDKEYQDDDSLIISASYNDLIDIITRTYELGRSNSNIQDVGTHFDAVNSMCNEIMKKRK